MRTPADFRTVTVVALTLATVSAAAVAQPPDDAPRKYVYALNAGGFSFKDGTLQLSNVASTLYFAPGTFGQVSNADFVQLWGKGSDSFASNAPFAALRVLSEGGDEVVLAVSYPTASGSTVRFQAAVVSGAPPSISGPCTLFLDPSKASAAPAAAKEPINKRDKEAREVIALFKQKDPSLEKFFKEAAGWVVFPTIAKGGLIVGGARGDGVVYANDEVIGYSVVSQGTVGLQIGGQAYSEIIFFADEPALNHFKKGNAELSAQASAVAVKAGASADASYADGVAVFTMAKGGAMLEASVGGQGFSFEER